MYMGKKADKVNPAEELLARWTRCHLSGELLAPPVVMDDLGNLYNKDTVVHALLNKALPPGLGHITGLKQVVEVKLHRSQSGAASQRASSSQTSFQPSNEADFSCPLAGVPCNGRYRFFVHRATGLMVSEKAIKEASAAVEELLGCKWKEEDLVPINPTGEQLEAVRNRLGARLKAEKEKKQSRKASKAAEAAALGAGPLGGAAEEGRGGELGPSGRETEAALSLKQPDGSSTQPADKVAEGKKRPASDLPRQGKKHTAGKPPQGATPGLYASLFTSSIIEPQKETYCCRATGARGVHLT